MGEEDLCVCVPGLYPKDPRLGTPSVSCVPTPPLWAQEKGPRSVRTLPSPRMSPF